MTHKGRGFGPVPETRDVETMNDTDVTFEVWGTNEYGEEYRVTERNESGAREVAELMNRISEAGRHYYVVKAITTRTPV